MTRVLAEGKLGGVDILRHVVALIQRVLAWPSPGKNLMLLLITLPDVIKKPGRIQISTRPQYPAY
jgi:hypothetical protein